MGSGGDLLSYIDFDKQGGLVPVVVQDAVTGEILMLGYADRTALRMTLETGLAHFYSRSRRKLWMKGETSGNVLRVVAVTADCDYDSIFYLAVPAGNTCHTGRWSCFHNALWEGPAEDLAWDLLVESLRSASREGEIIASPLTTCEPPPNPLLLSIAAHLLLRGLDRRVADSAAAVGGCVSAGMVLGQRLGLPTHLDPSSAKGRVAVLGAVYDRRAREAVEALRSSGREVAVEAFLLAEAQEARGQRSLRRLAEFELDGSSLMLRDPSGSRSARIELR